MCMSVCGLEISRMRLPRPEMGCWATKKWKTAEKSISTEINWNKFTLRSKASSHEQLIDFFVLLTKNFMKKKKFFRNLQELVSRALAVGMYLVNIYKICREYLLIINWKYLKNSLRSINLQWRHLHGRKNCWTVLQTQLNVLRFTPFS
jgi:hypothetical protein